MLSLQNIMKYLALAISARTYVPIVFVLLLGFMVIVFVHHQDFVTLASAFIGAFIVFGLNILWNIREQEKKDIASANHLGSVLAALHRTQCAFCEHYDLKRKDSNRVYTIALLIIDNLDRQESISKDVEFLTRLDEPKVVDNIQIVVRHYNNLIKTLIKRERYINILQDRIRAKYIAGAANFRFINKKTDPDWPVAENLTDTMIESCDQNIRDIEDVMAQLGEIMLQKFPKANIHHFRRQQERQDSKT